MGFNSGFKGLKELAQDMVQWHVLPSIYYNILFARILLLLTKSLTRP